MPPIPFLERTDRIIITTRPWSGQRIGLGVRAYHRMGHDYAIYNKMFFGGKLQEPTLDLDDGPARFLPWTSRCGSLFVPMKIAEKQPWRMVQETLLQQMVHQHLFRDHGLDEDPAHTRAFHRFCEQPKVRLALAMSCGLPGFAAPTLSPDETRLMQRIQRLLALGDSPNRHEAEAALDEAHRLMLKHNIDMSLQADPLAQRYGLRHLGRPLDAVNEAQRLLSTLLKEHFFVKSIWVKSYDLRRNKEGSVLEICGSRANLDLASHVYHFLMAAAERLWEQHRDGSGQVGNKGQADFRVGVFRGFREKLYMQQKKNQVAGLIWLGDSGLDEFYTQLYPKTVPLEETRKSKETAALLAGIAAGRRLELHRPIGDPHRGGDQRQDDPQGLPALA